MDHYRYPRNKGRIKNPDFTSGSINPSCGDSVSMQGCIANNSLSQVVFEGKGCVISQATASMLAQAVIGKPCDQVCSLDKEFVLSMIGIDLGPIRLKCALLPLQALQEGVAQYINSRL